MRHGFLPAGLSRPFEKNAKNHPTARHRQCRGATISRERAFLFIKQRSLESAPVRPESDRRVRITWLDCSQEMALKERGRDRGRPVLVDGRAERGQENPSTFRRRRRRSVRIRLVVVAMMSLLLNGFPPSRRSGITLLPLTTPAIPRTPADIVRPVRRWRLGAPVVPLNVNFWIPPPVMRAPGARSSAMYTCRTRRDARVSKEGGSEGLMPGPHSRTVGHQGTAAICR